MQSAVNNPGPVEEYLAEEQSKGRLLPAESEGVVVGSFISGARSINGDSFWIYRILQVGV